MNAATAPATLVDLLRQRGGDDSGGGYRFLDTAADRIVMLPYPELERRSRDVAAELSLLAPPGARAVLLYPPGTDFIVAFFGAIYAGVVPVPVYPPGASDVSRALDRIEHICTDARPDALLTTGSLLAAKEAAGLAVGPAGVRWLATDQVPAGAGADWVAPRVSAEDVALLQYTSGSTAAPKGVVIRHRQLLANLTAIKGGMELTADTVAVGWVPSYHDMGLIGFIIEALYAGLSSYLIAPQDFLRRPVLWLETISRFGAEASGGPNFGYELCTRRITESEMEGIDLSSWRLAFSGAERVRPDVLRRFCARFASAGFAPESLYPCYGLAEASLFVSGARRGTGGGSVWLDRRGLEDGLARPSAQGAADAVEVASCGRVADGHRVVIADPTTARPAEGAQVGEVWVAGPSVAAGYWRRPEESADVFAAALSDGSGPFLRTGDLGFMRDDELYLTGRIRELLVVNGRNIYPTDVEDAAQAVGPRLRPGCGACFLNGEDSSDLVIVQETTEEDQEQLRLLALGVRTAVLRQLNVAVADVVLVRPRTVPKTSSGKLRRLACRQDYLDGALDAVFRLRATERAGG